MPCSWFLAPRLAAHASTTDPGAWVMMTDSAAVPPRRILVVEDDVLLQRLMTRVLADGGYGAVTVPNGMAALALLKRDPEAFDLVVTGIALPILDGLELYRMLRRLGLRIPVLFVSGFVENEVTRELGRDTGARFLTKPWTLDELQATVREILEGVTHDAPPTE